METIESMPPMDDGAIHAAIRFAMRAHKGQRRKGSQVAYIFHPLSVARILINHGAPQEVVLAGILHDTIEDTPVNAGDIAEQFGPDVARLVLAVTEPDKSASWEARKQHTIQSLHNAERDVLMLACADKLDNILSIYYDLPIYGRAVFERFYAPPTMQEWYYRSLTEIFRKGLPHAPASVMVNRLGATVDAVFSPQY